MSGAHAAPVDVAVVGAGPAGCAALLHLVRAGARVAAFCAGPVGGLLPAARRIDNLPGYPGGVAGRALARAYGETLRAAGIAVAPLRIDAVEAAGTGGARRLRLFRGGETAAVARAVIVATGTAPVPLADALPPQIDPAPFLRDATGFPGDLSGRAVLVIGGGEAAFDTALSARDRGATVTILARGPSVRAHAGLVREAAAAGIALRTGAILASTRRTGDAWAARLADGHELAFHIAAACLGRRVELPRLPGETERDGIFLCGDCAGGAGRYVAPALAGGILAAQAALERVAPRGGDPPNAV